jgi:hypothetical protein
MTTVRLLRVVISAQLLPEHTLGWYRKLLTSILPSTSQSAAWPFPLQCVRSELCISDIEHPHARGKTTS